MSIAHRKNGLCAGLGEMRTLQYVSTGPGTPHKEAERPRSPEVCRMVDVTGRIRFRRREQLAGGKGEDMSGLELEGWTAAGGMELSTKALCLCFGLGYGTLLYEAKKHLSRRQSA